MASDALGGHHRLRREHSSGESLNKLIIVELTRHLDHADNHQPRHRETAAQHRNAGPKKFWQIAKESLQWRLECSALTFNSDRGPALKFGGPPGCPATPFVSCLANEKLLLATSSILICVYLWPYSVPIEVPQMDADERRSGPRFSAARDVSQLTGQPGPGPAPPSTSGCFRGPPPAFRGSIQRRNRVATVAAGAGRPLGRRTYVPMVDSFQVHGATQLPGEDAGWQSPNPRRGAMSCKTPTCG